ncbi:VOC family protein [Nocardioides alkalitolerans]|uniref:VOC family protein n=1 Tax=Nocardioides alkalitolerans TaxID=281714 RepID=UPI001FE0D3F4|nr:VOC family protein [Nocardioides alkalitolerans]
MTPVLTAPVLDHVGLSVGDLPAMSAWYAAAFGLAVDLEFTVAEVGLSGTMLRSPEGFRIELLARAGSTPGLQPGSAAEAALTRGFGHVAFDVPDVDTTYDALLAAGATDRMSPRPSPEPGVRMAFVADPEGNLVELLDRTSSSVVEEGAPAPVSKPRSEVRA